MKKSTLLIGLLSFFLLFIQMPVHANEMGFSVRTILPENQQNRESTYYDLKMTPGQTQVIQVVLTNDTDQEKTIEMSANPAITNDNGIVEYTLSDPPLDESMKNPFSKIASIPKEVTLAGGESKTVDVTLKMPETPFDGYILGGLYFKAKESGVGVEKDENVQIDNQFSYTVGVLLSETDAMVKPELNLTEVIPNQRVGKNVLLAHLENTTSSLVKDLKVEAQVYQEGAEKPSYVYSQEALRMAPNSSFNLTIPLGDDAFVPGDYHVVVQASAVGEEWKFTKEFTIAGKEADKLNKTAIQLEKPEKTWPVSYTVVIVGAMIFAIVGGFLLGKKSKAK